MTTGIALSEPIPNVSESATCVVNPSSLFDPDPKIKNLVSSVSSICICWSNLTTPSTYPSSSIAVDTSRATASIRVTPANINPRNTPAASKAEYKSNLAGITMLDSCFGRARREALRGGVSVWRVAAMTVVFGQLRRHCKNDRGRSVSQYQYPSLM